MKARVLRISSKYSQYKPPSWAALFTKDCLYLLHLRGQKHVQAYQAIALIAGQPLPPLRIRQISISAADCIEHTMTLRAESAPDSVVDQVMTAALQYLPGTLDQFVVDYKLLDEQRVRWVAAPVAQVSAHQQQWPQAKILEPRADAHARALALLPCNADCVAVVEINHGQVEISWHWQQQILHTLAADIVVDIPNEIAALLTQHTVERALTQLVICGEMATLELAKALEHVLLLPVLMADITQCFTYAADIEPAQLEHTPFFSLVGLALRHTDTAPMNFLPWRKKLMLQQRYRFLRQMGLISTLAAAILCSVHGYCQHLITQQQQNNQKLQQQIQVLQPALQQVQTLKVTQTNISNNLAWLQQLQWQRDRWAALLLLLGNTMPDSLGLLTLAAHDQQIVITGVVQDPPALQQWVQQLQASPLFSTVQLTATTPQQFTITLTWAK